MNKVVFFLFRSISSMHFKLQRSKQLGRFLTNILDSSTIDINKKGVNIDFITCTVLRPVMGIHAPRIASDITSINDHKNSYKLSDIYQSFTVLRSMEFYLSYIRMVHFIY